MKRLRDRVLLLLLCLLLLVPAGAVQPPQTPDYGAADEIFEGLYDWLDGRKARMSDSLRADYARRFLESAEGVAPDSIRRCGDALFWSTEDGITCHFSPQLYALMTGTAAPETQEIILPQSKGVTPSDRDVYLIAPYYGLDDAFEGEGGTYNTWAKILARFTGGKSLCLTRNTATVDTVAAALTNCAALLIDSHGDTDTGDMYGATSYICLQNGNGITVADYAYDEAAGTCHAAYGGSADGGKISYYEVDGTVIANHMKKSASDCLIWNGTCFGMGTQGFCEPLLQKGVGVIYGYSQPVSFGADRLWMETTMDELTNGRTFGAAFGLAQKQWGGFDYSRAVCEANDWPDAWINESAAQAVANHDAFPVAVSAKDPYPAEPNAVHTVRSDWVLPRLELTVTLSVPDGVKCPSISAYMFYRGKLPEPSGRPRNADAAYTFEGWCLREVLPGGPLPEIYKPGTAFSFGFSEPDEPLDFGSESVTIYALYSYEAEGKTLYTTRVPDGPDDPYDPSRLFDDMPYGTWYYDAVRYAVAGGLVNGYSDGTFRPVQTIRRSEVVSILYRAAGAPEVSGTSAFSDVAPTAWYGDAVTWAVENGIVEGYSDGTFRPDAPVTRAQLAVLFYRFAGAASTDTAALKPFPDDGKVPAWACKELAWAVANGLINGSRIDGKDYLQPQNSATRAQFVAILERYQTN